MSDLLKPGEDSRDYLLRQRERQIHALQSRMDRANTLLSNAVLVKKPNYKRAVFAAIKALSY
jgi:hypothetical protein